MVPAKIVSNQHAWAVVTGASSGIGRAFALELARRGHPILLVARRGDELQRLAAEITAAGGRAEPLVADLASAGGVEAVARAAEGLSDVGVLVNNAGAGSYGPFLEQPLGRDAAQVALNIDAVVALTRRLLPRMVARGRGQIINVASILAFMPTPYFATYAATKAFVLSFSEALAQELRGTGVRVLAASPGVVKTEFSGVAGSPEQESALPKLTPDAVVRATLRAAESGRVVRVVGPAYRLLAVLAAITPRPLMRRIMGRIFAPRKPALSSEQHLLT
ncbi:MAG: SDR family NAD(P)-dependent oxidoreductase [Myxococcales bacterium]